MIGIKEKRKKKSGEAEEKKWRMMISRHTMTVWAETHANAFVHRIVIAGNDGWWFSDPMISRLQQKGEKRVTISRFL